MIVYTYIGQDCVTERASHLVEYEFISHRSLGLLYRPFKVDLWARHILAWEYLFLKHSGKAPVIMYTRIWECVGRPCCAVKTELFRFQSSDNEAPVRLSAHPVNPSTGRLSRALAQRGFHGARPGSDVCGHGRADRR